ncbi:MAG: hydroxyacid dehydrogenase [Sporolactobacillus sp.]|jgi:D-3-phosphoglycerate dehydrogenase/(S)-sulfolactate dehydrogenase|nr:hydroxyacid dehydrogenase [Sporolactobacillus sp.]
MKIVISEKMDESGISKLSSLGTIEVLPNLWKDKRELIWKIHEADILIIRNQTVVDQDVLRSAKNLKIIGRLGVGLDNIDLVNANKLKIKIISAKNANAISVSEYVFAVLLSTSRLLDKANEDVKQGNWNRSQFTGIELYGKTLGLIGVGEIGRRVAKRAIAFGLQVIGYDPFVNKLDYPFSETGIVKVGLKDLLERGDFISLHVPLVKNTKALIGTEELKRMKKTAILINSSRGGIVDENALLKALDEGRPASAYLDVLAEEPIKKNNPLIQNRKVHLTPHIAGVTRESQRRIADLIATEIIKVANEKNSLYTVHIPV